MNALIKLRQQVEPFKLHLLALGIAGLLGLSVGLMKTMVTPPRVSNSDRWVLPQWTPFQAGPTKQGLTGLTIFTQDPGKKKLDATAEANTPSWRFTGTVREGNRQVALIETDKGLHIRRILPGDVLPGGATVTTINTGELTYTDSAGEQTLKLFSSGATSPPATKHQN